MFFSKLKNISLDILFPPLCLGCQKNLGGKNKFICDACFSSIKLNNTLFCPVCQARLPENKPICSHGSEKFRQFPYLIGAAANYNDKTVQNLIHYHKYKNFSEISAILSNILIKYLELTFENSKLKIENFAVTYIPLHFIKESKRGFNQSKLLAETVSNKFNLEFIDALIRIKNNPAQAKTKNYQERNKNISNAFKIICPEKIANKNIILIDDVYTSGATMSEAARLLKSAGAKKIICLVLAKA